MVNLHANHANALRLRCGDSLVLTSRGQRVSVPYLGFTSRQTLEIALGSAWVGAHLGPAGPTCGLVPFGGSEPWVLRVDHTALQAEAPVAAARGDPWCDVTSITAGDADIGFLSVAGSVVACHANGILLNFGWTECMAAGIRMDDPMELLWRGGTCRAVMARTGPFRMRGRRDGEPTLACQPVPYWNARDVSLLVARPDDGTALNIRIEAGDPVVLSAAG